ncbi:MAG: pyridoxal-dependent decarboxylase [Candidatus Aminicenantes bacterium]|nr:pyridoxal-dependent decarboxylase [Candidatus Aminicenantes bacterium]
MLPPTIASLIVSIQNPNNIVPAVSEATTQMEKECIDFFAGLIGYNKDKEPWGNIVSCGTIANMTALLVARDYSYDKLDRPRKSMIGRRGIVNRTPGVVLTSASAHYSLKKALWFLGLGSDNLIEIPVAVDEIVLEKREKDERFIDGISDKTYKELILTAMEREERQNELERFYNGEDAPFSLQPLDSEIFKALYSCFTYNTPLLAAVYSLGTTETGTIERMDSKEFGTIAFDLLKREDIYIHADAAIGGYTLAIPSIKEKMKGIERCDSVTIDGHKLGFLPYPCGAIVFQHRGYKHQIYQEAPYLKNLAPTLEGSRPGSNIAACWVAQKTLGVEGYSEYIGLLLEFTRKIEEEIRKSKNFQLLHQVDLNTISFCVKRKGKPRSILNQMTIDLAERINGNNIFVVNTTDDLAKIKVKNLPGKDDSLTDIKTIRIVFTNPLVELEDVNLFIYEIENQLAALEKEKDYT